MLSPYRESGYCDEIGKDNKFSKKYSFYSNLRLIILDKIYEIYFNEYNLELFNVIKSLAILSVLKKYYLVKCYLQIQTLIALQM